MDDSTMTRSDLLFEISRLEIALKAERDAKMRVVGHCADLVVELQTEREKVAKLACAPSNICMVPLLQEQLAAEREKAWELRRVDKQREEVMLALHKEATIAQATAAEMREQLTRIIGDHNAPSDCYSTGPKYGDWRDHSCPSCEGLRLLALPTNQDALHEAMAMKLDKLADRQWREAMDKCKKNRINPAERNDLFFGCSMLREEAAAHRARKEGK